MGALGVDLISETRGGWGVMPSAMKMTYGYVPTNWKTTSYTTTVSKMLTTGEIKRVEVKGKSYLELTSDGKREFKRYFPLLTKTKKWDGRFMIVIYDIPEKQKIRREILRGKLQELGFGMLQESVWISPHHFEEDMREFLVNNNLGKYAYVLTARKLLLGDTKKLVSKVWDLEKLNNSYKKIYQKLMKYQKRKVANKVLGGIIHSYLSIIKEDPMLPNELLPNDWQREKIVKVLRSMF